VQEEGSWVHRGETSTGRRGKSIGKRRKGSKNGSSYLSKLIVKYPVVIQAKESE